MYDRNARWEGERSWARDQLDVAEATPHERGLVMELLEVWWDTALKSAEDGDVWKALDLFETLARGKAVPPPEQQDVRWQWVDAKPGQLVVRDYVRVKLDAYSGEAGQLHNGRSGPIVRISAGDVLVKYDDNRLPKIEGLPPRHSPYKLEKRIPA